MSTPKHLIIGGQSLPFDLAAIVEAKSETLALSLAPVQFDFVYRDIRFACRCESQGQTARLKVVGDLGALPFSAESPRARMAIQAIAEDANTHLGTAFRVAQGRILLGGERDFPLPITAAALIGALTAFLLRASPYLDLIAEVIRPPLQPAKPGESRVRREWRAPPRNAR